MIQTMLQTAAIGLLFVGFCADAAEPTPLINPAKHVNAPEAQQLLADKKIWVLDIRTPEEYKSGHLAGATNVNFMAVDFEHNLAKLDKKQAFLVYCASGNRSTRALPVLKKLEFQTIYHLDGGFNAWEKAGLPVKK